MVFRFTASGGNNNISNNLRSVTDLDGRHIARFTGKGLMGLGNTFGILAGGGNYVRPASLLHLSYDRKGNQNNERYGFMQITYRDVNFPTRPGAGETERDGLRFGIDNQLYHGAMNAFLRWQENTPFIIQTDWNNSPGGIQNGERMRISSVNAPFVPNPASGGGNITRVSISHRGNQPVTKPRALLHLGYNTGLSNPFSFEDGWRDWMDIGTFTSNGTDNMYVGLKDEGNDRYDAIINWGDNQVSGQTTNNGPDYLRFIFTSTTTALTGQGDPISQSNDGLEIMRIAPNRASSMDTVNATNYGMVGIGNFASNGPNTNPNDSINAKLDIDGDLRIRQVLQNDTLNKVLVIDTTDHNRVYWRDLGSFGNGFTECSDTINGFLMSDSKVNLNNYNLYFENNDTLGQNLTGFGYDCGTILPAKVSVYQDHSLPTNSKTIAISAINNDSTVVLLNEQVGIYAQSIKHQKWQIRPSNIAGEFKAGNATKNMGVKIFVSSDSLNDVGESNFGVHATVLDTNSTINLAGHFNSVGGKQCVGARGEALSYGQTNLSVGLIGRSQGNAVQNVGVFGYNWSGFSNLNAGIQQNIGVVGLAAQSNLNIGIYGETYSNSTSTDYAGYFAGTVVTGPSLLASDSTLKTNIDSIPLSIDSLLMNIDVVSFEFKQNGNSAYLKNPDGTRFGVIAQQVEQFFPELVKEVHHPAKLDTTGAIINPSFTYKAVDMVQFIPLMLNDLKMKNETLSNINSINDTQDSIIESLSNQNDSLELVVTDLNNRLTQLENCLGNILPFLCQLSNSAVQNTDEEIQEKLNEVINVELSDKNNIVLNQNVPNPFAERTVISYSVPESVQKAQIHFYNGMGQLINTVEITERGKGEINVYANDLSSGIYTYSLVADGKIVATKRMMKE